MKLLSQLALRREQILQKRLPLLATGLSLLGRHFVGQSKGQFGPDLPSTISAHVLHVITSDEPGKGFLQIAAPPFRTQNSTVHMLTVLGFGRQTPVLGTSAGGKPKSKITQTSPGSHGTGGVRVPAVEQSDPSEMHPMPFSWQHSAALKGDMGAAHLSRTFSTGPKISKLDSHDAACSEQRLQNKDPSLARSLGVTHSLVQGKEQSGPGESMRVAQARHVPTRDGDESDRLEALQIVSGPLAEQNSMEQAGGGEGSRKHVPTRGWSAAGKPKEKRTQVKPDGHGGVSTGPTTKPSKEHGKGTGEPLSGWAAEMAKKARRITIRYNILRMVQETMRGVWSEL